MADDTAPDPQTDSAESPFQKRLFELLGDSRRDDAVEAMIAALDEPDAATVKRAVKSLIQTQNEDGLAAVVARYDALPEDVKQLADSEERLFQQAAMRMTSSPVQHERVQAIEYLKVVGDAEAVPTLTRLMSSQDKEIRNAAMTSVQDLVNQHVVADTEDEQAAASDLPETAEQRQERKRRRADRRRERIAILDALHEGLRTFNVHHNEDIIRLAFTLGEHAFKLLRPYAGGNSSLATKIRGVMLQDCGPKHLRFLLELLRDENPSVVTGARTLLSQFDPARYAAALSAVLETLPIDEVEPLSRTDAELSWWTMAADKVSEFSEEAMNMLMEVARCLPQQRDRIRLCDAALRSRHGGPQRQALDMLAAIGSQQAWSTVTRAFDSPDRELQIYAMTKILHSDLEDKLRFLAPLINSTDEEIRSRAIREVSSMSLDRYLKSFSTLDPRHRVAAAKALLKIDPGLANELAATLGSMDPRHRLHAVQLLQTLGKEKDAEDALMKLIADPDAKVRASVIKAMGVLGTVEAVKAVLKSIKDSDRRVRANAIEALEALQHPQVRTMILPLMEHPDNRIRGNAVKALLLMGEPTARLALDNMLHHKDPMMRRTGVWALRESNLPDAIPKLKELAEKDADAGVREKAAAAMRVVLEKQEGGQ